MPSRNRISRSLHFLTILFLAAALWSAVNGLAGSHYTALAQDGGPTGAAYRGQRIFSERCVQCHGEQGRGDGPMASEAPVPIADFTDPAYGQSRSPDEIYEIISNGRLENLMPPWKDALSQDQIWDAVAYIWSLHLDAAALGKGQQLYSSACAECHGVEGLGAAAQPAAGSLADPSLLALDESEWLASVTAASHPPVAGLDDQALAGAASAARSFNLGFAIDTPTVAGNGAIEVLVSNGTTGALAGELPVRLLIIEGEELISSRAAETNADGLARFEGLPTDTSWTYILQAEYLDLPYSSDMLQFEPASAQLRVPLNVYEAGASLDDIRISRAHWVINLDNPHRLDIGELYAFVNTSDRVYVGEGGEIDGQPQVLTFHLPPNATNLSFEDGEIGARYQRDVDQVYDTLPLAPGQRQIFFRYSIAVEDGMAELAHPFAYAVDTLNLLVPDLGMEIEAPGWTENPSQQTQGGAFLNYTLSNIAPEESANAIFTNISADLFSGTGTNASSSGNRQVIDSEATPGISGLPLLPWLVGAFALVVLGAGTYLALQRQRTLQQARPAQRRRQREWLIQEIADLDDAYEAGEIAAGEYEAERRLLKAQLVAVLSETDA